MIRSARFGWTWAGIWFVASMMLPTAAQAQSTVYWDIDGPTPGAGGTTPSGTWSSVATNWSPSAAGDAATSGWVSGANPGEGDVAFFSAGSDATGAFTVTVDGTNNASGFVVNQGTLTLSGSGVVQVGSGTVTVGPGAALGMTALGRVTQSAGGRLVLDGGKLFSANPGNASSIWTSLGSGILLTSRSGTVEYNLNSVTIFSGAFLGEGGTTTNGGAQMLTKTGTSEFRVQGAQTANYTIAKLNILGGLYRIGSSTNASGQTSTETGFGALPTGGEAPDAITLDGGAIGTSFSVSTDPWRGITLGSNGGVINTVAAPLTLNGPITGSGPLRLIGRSATLTGVNTATGGTIIGSDIAMVGSITTTTAGTATINGDSNLGAVPATVDATNVRLGTDTASAILTVNATTLFPATRGFRVGAAGGTLSTVTAATVTLAGPLSGPGAFIKTSSGTLVLSGSNTISGGITSWGGGLLEVSSDANLGAVSGTLQPTALTIAGATTSGRVRAAQTFSLHPNRGITINVGGTTASPLGGTIDVVADKTLTVPGPITGGGRLTKSGAGTLVLSGSSNYAGTTTVSSGTLTVSGVVTGTARVSVIGGATLVLASPGALATRSVTSSTGAKVTLAPYLETAVGGLAATAGGLTDVQNGKLTVIAGLSATDLVTALVAGRNGGTWDGTSGITSTVTAAQVAAFELRAVGWMDNGDGSLTTAYAAQGDTNLDWVVDILDVSNFVSSGKFGTGEPATWMDGDFNYDGVVDIQDVADFSATGLYGAGSYNSRPGIAAVPEPAGVGAVAALGVAAWLAVRRRAGSAGR